MPTIVHFEMPADDIERSKKFYTDLFGWKIEKLSVADDSRLTSAGLDSANGILDNHNNR